MLELAMRQRWVIVAGAGLALALLHGDLAAQSRPRSSEVRWSPHREDAVVQQAAASSVEAEVELAAQLEEPELFNADVESQAIGTGIGSRRPVRPVSYASRASFEQRRSVSRNPYASRHLGTRTSPLLGSMHTQYTQAPGVYEEIQGQPQFMEDGAEIYAGDYAGGPVDAACGCGGIGCGNCCGPCICLPRPNLCNLELFAGVHGFTGPANRGSTGSFGFHEGVNWGTPLLFGLTAQAGFQVAHSNFNGNVLTAEDRTQTFVTLGGFRRVDWGLQGGLVIDYYNDEWDYDADLTQLRGELSWRFACNHEVGFWFAAGMNDTTTTANVALAVPGANAFEVGALPVNMEATDMYAFFYRRQFSCGGEGRVYGGFTDNSQAIFGGDASLPINPCLALQSDFIYLSGGDREDGLDFLEESWNVSLSIVWTPFAPRGCQPCGPNYCRPLMNVANNGSFIPRLQ